EATVWFKLPLSPSWNAEIDRYLQRGRAKKVYLCTTREDKTGTLANTPSPVIPVTLEANSHWKRECFTIVLSEEFSSLLVARLQAAPARRETRWQLFYVFDLSVIERLLESLERSIAITDTTPEDILALRSFPPAPNPGVTLEALQQLLFKQIRQTERVQERVT
ncbi:DICT sensory domain-containing protein, partial [Arcanobacterium phocae]